MPIPPHVRARRAALAEVAKETKAVLPGILQQLPHLQAAESQVYSLDDLPALDVSSTSPRFELVSSPPAPSSSSSPSPRTKTYGTRIKVLNSDTLDAAIMMADSLGTQQQQQQQQQQHHVATAAAATATTTTGVGVPPAQRNQRIAVMNLASDVQPGGGWLTGAIAQEEALCYRSSLALSLHRRYYPLAPRSAIYTRDVVVVRSSMASGHRLLLSHPSPPSPPAASLPVVSVISVAGIRKPELRKVMASALFTAGSGSGSGAGAGAGAGLGSSAVLSRDREERAVFRHAADRDLTKAKMRLALRAAARAGSGSHELLVLGALGCGAFRNPPGEVARCWLEVLDGEAEFAGGRWFREIWFAVLDRRNEGNFDVFERVLGGREVGKVVVQG